MHGAAGQTPQQETVDRAEGQVSVVRQAPGTVDVIENPCDLGRREIRVEAQPRLAGNHIVRTALPELAAISCRTPVLPDNRVVDAFAAASVPHHRRLALVGNPDSGDLAHGEAGFAERFPRDVSDRRPDLLRVVFDPARLRVDLAEFLLRARDDVRALIVNDGTAAARTLVYRQQVLRRHVLVTPSGIVGI